MLYRLGSMRKKEVIDMEDRTKMLIEKAKRTTIDKFKDTDTAQLFMQLYMRLEAALQYQQELQDLINAYIGACGGGENA